MSAHRILAASGLLAAVVSFAGPASSQTFTPRPEGGIKGALLPSERSLWIYEAATGTYVLAAGDVAKPYVPNLRKPSKPLTFAFAEGWAAIPFSVAINNGIYRIADELGIEIVYCDQEFDAEKAVTCAEQLAQQKPDFAIDSNWQSGAAEAVMKIYDAAKDPGRQHRRLASQRGSSSAPTTTSRASSAARPPANMPRRLGKCADVILLRRSTPARARPPTSASPASRTASRGLRRASGRSASSRRSSTPAPPTRR